MYFRMALHPLPTHTHTTRTAPNPQFRKSVRKVSVCVSGPVRPALWSLSIGGPAEGSYGVKALLWNIATWLSGAAQRGTRTVYYILGSWLHAACCLSRWCACAVSQRVVHLCFLPFEPVLAHVLGHSRFIVRCGVVWRGVTCQAFPRPRRRCGAWCPPAAP
jgi:hypothetical protein